MKIYRAVGLSMLLVTGVSLVSCSDKNSEKMRIHAENFKTDAVNTLPLGNLETVRYEEGVLWANGWCADAEDGAPVQRVMIYVDNKLLGQAELDRERPDVAKHFNNPKWSKSGWEMKAELPLARRKHTLFAFCYDKRDAPAKVGEDKEFVVD
jgi:hypothetical protein